MTKTMLKEFDSKQHPSQAHVLPKTEDAGVVELHSGYKIFKRFVHLSIMIIASVLLFYLVFSIQRANHEWQRTQIPLLGNTLSQHYAGLLSEQQPLSADKITPLLTTLIADSRVLHVSIYDESGNIITSSDGAFDLLSTVTQLPDTLVYVKPIGDETNTTGYLRLTVNGSELVALPSDYQREHITHLVLVAILGVLLGGYLMRLFYKLRKVSPASAN